jgi:hypothetical protein
MGLTKRRSTADEFYRQLGQIGGPDLVVFAQWAVDQASAHGLTVRWGSAGPLLSYVHPKYPGFPFTFGQLDRSGRLAQRQSVLRRRCEELGAPIDAIADYLQTVAALIPGACVKAFPLPGNKTEERVVAGPEAAPADWPPLAPLASHKEQWFAAIDRAIVRIREVLDRRPALPDVNPRGGRRK